MIPEFAECWWDSLFLDVLLCNAFGICLGMLICKGFQIPSFNWEFSRYVLKKLFIKYQRCEMFDNNNYLFTFVFILFEMAFVCVILFILLNLMHVKI